MTVAAVTDDLLAPASLQAHALDLLERDAWSREQLLEYQRRRLRETIRYAVEHSPYYRDALGPDAEEADLFDLPTLSKSVFMEEFDRVVTDPRLRRSELESFLDAADAGELYDHEYRLFSTSGTTGVPGLFVYSRAEFAHWAAVFLRGFVRLGVTADTRIAGIGAPSSLHLSRQVAGAIVAGRPGSIGLAVTMPTPTLVAALAESPPEVLVGYPTVLSMLAEEQLDGRLQISPRVVVTASEVLTADAAQKLEAAWARPVDMYASTELGLIAMGSLAHVGLHVCEEGIVEVVDDDDRPVAPGVPGSKVLLTNFVNRAQPLIRYELSDSVVVAEGPDPSGRPYDRIARIDGRSDEVLTLPAQIGGVVRVHPFHLRSPFVRMLHVRQYQIVHRGDELLVRVVLRPEAPSGTPAVVSSAMEAALAGVGAAVSVRVAVVDEIAREAGHAAKLTLVSTQYDAQ
jgi:putative adenylate-forming enzyme